MLLEQLHVAGLRCNVLQEFHPYVFQIFSQLIELRATAPALKTQPLPDVYLQLLQPFLTPALWERYGNVPALTRLMRAYLSKAAAEIVQRNLLVVSIVFGLTISFLQAVHPSLKFIVILVGPCTARLRDPC